VAAALELLRQAPSDNVTALAAARGQAIQLIEGGPIDESQKA
jgi:hypothetical protein